ncbi:MAG: protein kinase [Aridibacter famidurans]|nr:protein kinase [Aridibacter famidurans]
MPDIDRNRVNEILEEVLEIEPSEREDFLSNAGLSREVLKEVELLLSLEEEAASSLNLAAIRYSHDFLDAADEVPVGQVIDVYRITGELGSGGMGAVFLAERTDGNLEQKVALKLLKRELNTAALRARFSKEREILASLEHPSIARLLNAGTTEDGIPFLAMEYVDGLPIDEFCDRHSLGLNERLEMFIKVCEAVGFAHRNLVVHRDLKPSNILVDKSGVPKLLDFGISKILTDEIGETGTATITNLGVMTPSYASPEQLQKQSVTTAADIYSLGVILYELMSGVRPFESKEDDLKAIYEAVVDEPPAPPSYAARARGSSAGQGHRKDFLKAKEETPTAAAGETTAPSSSGNTRSDTHPVRWQQLRGDLDNIILKALKKEPERRYATAERLADDIGRFLKDLPVRARPDTLAYRTGKFLRRNALAASAAMLLFLAVMVGLGATLWQARQTEIAADRARAEAAKTRKSLQFVSDILNFASPFWSSSNPERKKDATIVEAMEIALANADKELADEPEVLAEVLFTLGSAYFGKGDYAKAEELLKRSISKYNELLGEGNTRAMQITGRLANQQYLQGKNDEAEQSYRAAVEYLRPRLDEGSDNALYLAGALTGLGNIQLLRGNYAEMESLNLEALELAEQFEGKDRRMIPVLLSNLGTANLALGKLPRSEMFYEKALDEMRSRGSVEHMEGAAIYGRLGQLAMMEGDLGKAQERLNKSYDIYLKRAGERNPYAIVASNRLAQLYLRKGELDKAEAEITRVMQIEKEVFPNGHRLSADSRSLLGDLYTKQGKLKEGEAELRQALAYLKSTLKQPNPEIANTEASLSRNLLAQERRNEAGDLLRSAYDSLVATNGLDHPETVGLKKELEKLGDKR